MNIFSKHSHTSRDSSSVYTKEAHLQEDNGILLFVKEERSRGTNRLHCPVFSIEELEEILATAKRQIKVA